MMNLFTFSTPKMQHILGMILLLALAMPTLAAKDGPDEDITKPTSYLCDRKQWGFWRILTTILIILSVVGAAICFDAWGYGRYGGGSDFLVLGFLCSAVFAFIAGVCISRAWGYHQDGEVTINGKNYRCVEDKENKLQDDSASGDSLTMSEIILCFSGFLAILSLLIFGGFFGRFLPTIVLTSIFVITLGYKVNSMFYKKLDRSDWEAVVADREIRQAAAETVPVAETPQNYSTQDLNRRLMRAMPELFE